MSVVICLLFGGATATFADDAIAASLNVTMPDFGGFDTAAADAQVQARATEVEASCLSSKWGVRTAYQVVGMREGNRIFAHVGVLHYRR